MGNMKEAEANVWLATLEAATTVSRKDTEEILEVIKDVAKLLICHLQTFPPSFLVAKLCFWVFLFLWML
jgi:hypothetical protein